MESLDNLLTPQSPPKQKTGWHHYRSACRLGLLSVSTMLLTHVARLIPFIAPVAGLLAMGASIGVVGWAMVTKGDQRAELMGFTLAGVLGFMLGVWDAWELLTVIGLKYWTGLLVIGVLMALGFMSEGRANAK